MVITVEPGCYFNEFTMRPALADASKAHLLVAERIEHFMVRAVGGEEDACAGLSACLLHVVFQTQTVISVVNRYLIWRW